MAKKLSRPQIKELSDAQKTITKISKLKLSNLEMKQLSDAHKILSMVLNDITSSKKPFSPQDSSKRVATGCVECGFTCTGGCKTSCWATCSEGCGGCDFTCSGGCKSSCWATCSEGCGGCDFTCEGSCDTSCWGTNRSGPEG